MLPLLQRQSTLCGSTWPRWQKLFGRYFGTSCVHHYNQKARAPVQSIVTMAPQISYTGYSASSSRFSMNGVSKFGSVSVSLGTNGYMTNLFPTSMAMSLQRRWKSKMPRMSDCQTLEEAIDAIYDNLDIAAPRNLAAFWSVVPKLLQRGRRNGKRETRNPHANQMQKQLDEILVHTIEDVQRFAYRDLAQTTLAFAKIVKKVAGNERYNSIGSPNRILREMFIGKNNENKTFIFGCMAQASEPMLQEFDPRHLSNLIYAFGLVKYNFQYQDGSTLFDVLGEEAIPSLGKFIPQGLSNVVWAYANIGVSNVELFEKAGEVISKRVSLEDFWPQALSNIVWSYATVDLPHPKLFEKVGDHVVKLDNFQQFKSQALSNIVWSYATVKESHPKLFNKVGDHVVKIDNLQTFDEQHLSNIVWAYATAKESHSKLFKKVGDHIAQLDSLKSFKPQALANIIWAYATAKESHPKLFNKLGDHIAQLDSLKSFKPQELSNTVWSYATAKVSNPDLFQKVAKAAIEKQKEFDEQKIANLLWAFATNGQLDYHLFKSLTPAAIALINKCNSLDLANIAWVYAVADVAAPPLFNDDFVRACAKKEHNFITEELSQLHQWTLWQKELKSNVRLPASLEKKCHYAFISTEPSPSALQNDVVTQLTAIGLEPEEEVLTGSGYRIDATVEVDGNKLGIEVDGPFHFIGREPNGKTLLKRRQIPKLDGIPIVSVPYWEWNDLKRDSSKKQEYLRLLLRV